MKATAEGVQRALAPILAIAILSLATVKIALAEDRLLVLSQVIPVGMSMAITLAGWRLVIAISSVAGSSPTGQDWHLALAWDAFGGKERRAYPSGDVLALPLSYRLVDLCRLGGRDRRCRTGFRDLPATDWLSMAQAELKRLDGPEFQEYEIGRDTDGPRHHRNVEVGRFAIEHAVTPTICRRKRNLR